MQLTDSVKAVLTGKGRELWSVAPTASVYEALCLMADRDIGAVLVMEDDRLRGVISERDYARKVILLGKSSRETLVEEIMRTPEICVTPETTVDECMRLMTNIRVRHLPVVNGSRVEGIVSIGDLVNWIICSHEETIQHLHAYVGAKYP